MDIVVWQCHMVLCLMIEDQEFRTKSKCAATPLPSSKESHRPRKPVSGRLCLHPLPAARRLLRTDGILSICQGQSKGHALRFAPRANHDLELRRGVLTRKRHLSRIGLCLSLLPQMCHAHFEDTPRRGTDRDNTDPATVTLLLHLHFDIRK